MQGSLQESGRPKTGGGHGPQKAVTRGFDMKRLRETKPPGLK
jgi:hypothetical protein